MISKEQLTFDPTDANTRAESDSVGAYVRAGTDGALIDSQLVNSQEWLNTAAILYDDTGAAINNANPLPVEITSGVNVEVDLAHTDDSVRLGDGTNFLTSTTVGADIGLDVYLINTSIAVTATDLDIRDLLHTQDSIRLGDGTNFLTSTTVGADIGLDVNIINANVDVQDIANSSLKTTAKSATTTQSALLASALASRKFLYIQNVGNRAVYLAESGAADAAATGLKLSPGSLAEFRFGASANLDVKAAGGTQELRILEAA